MRNFEWAGTFGKWLLQLAKTDVLLLDDWGMAGIDSQTRADLLEIIDDRAANKASCPLSYSSPNAHSKREHSAAKARPGLIGVLDKLEPQQRPALVRGDCGFGNEPFIAELEGRAQPYLFKLRQTVGVKRLLARQFARDDWSTPGPSDQGWSAVEDTLKLSGWDKSRRVVVLRRAVKADLALSRKTKDEQIELLMPDKDVQAWEYAVLVTNSTYALEIFGQLYRDRADCENGFDELKNQWGWGGFTTQDIERCQTSARAVALIYNWWSWYCRAAKPGVRMEAITSRALLLAGVGRAVKHAGQTTLYRAGAAISCRARAASTLGSCAQAPLAAKPF